MPSKRAVARSPTRPEPIGSRVSRVTVRLYALQVGWWQKPVYRHCHSGSWQDYTGVLHCFCVHSSGAVGLEEGGMREAKGKKGEGGWLQDGSFFLINIQMEFCS